MLKQKTQYKPVTTVPILPFHVDLNVHYAEVFFVRKGCIGGTICQLMYLIVMGIMDLKCRHFGIILDND